MSTLKESLEVRIMSDSIIPQNCVGIPSRRLKTKKRRKRKVRGIKIKKYDIFTARDRDWETFL